MTLNHHVANVNVVGSNPIKLDASNQRVQDLKTKIEEKSAQLIQLETSQTIDNQRRSEIADLSKAIVNLRVELAKERVRADNYRERMEVARTMISSWSEMLDANASEVSVLFNLLFLQSQSLNGELGEDPAFLQRLLEQKVDTAIGYVNELDPKATSPIVRALWYELIAGWLDSSRPALAMDYRNQAVELVKRFAPEDYVWLNKLKEEQVDEP